MHAVVKTSNSIAPSLSSFLMRNNVWLPWALAEICVSASILVSWSLYRATATIPLRKVFAEADEDQVERASLLQNHNPVLGRRAMMFNALKLTKIFVVENSQATLLLFMALVGQIAVDSLPLMLLLYVSKRYYWSFADVCQSHFSIMTSL